MTLYTVTLERGTCECDCDDCFCQNYVEEEVEAYQVNGLNDEAAQFIRFRDRDSNLVAAYTTYAVHAVTSTSEE